MLMNMKALFLTGSYVILLIIDLASGLQKMALITFFTRIILLRKTLL